MKTPVIGRIMTVFGIESNGANEHTSIVTRVYEDHDIGPDIYKCNLTVFLDNAAPRNQTSVNVFPTRDDAMNWRDEQGHEPVVAFWPETK